MSVCFLLKSIRIFQCLWACTNVECGVPLLSKDSTHMQVYFADYTNLRKSGPFPTDKGFFHEYLTINLTMKPEKTFGFPSIPFDRTIFSVKVFIKKLTPKLTPNLITKTLFLLNSMQFSDQTDTMTINNLYCSPLN